MLAHAASKWVFASLHTQPLEAAAIRDRLALPGVPQMLLQLGMPPATSAGTAMSGTLHAGPRCTSRLCRWPRPATGSPVVYSRA
jgi:hypothetical protein